MQGLEEAEEKWVPVFLGVISLAPQASPVEGFPHLRGHRPVFPKLGGEEAPGLLLIPFPHQLSVFLGQGSREGAEVRG